MERWDEGMEKCWRRQVWETVGRKQARGPAGAMVCETRDLGVGFPSWHGVSFRVRFDRGHEGCVSTRCDDDGKKTNKRCGREIVGNHT